MKKLKKLLESGPGKIIAVIVGLIVLFFVSASYQQGNAIAKIIAEMKADSGWLANIQTKATAAGITLDKQLRLDALWVLSQADEYKGKWWNF
ncbi:MAG: hypothetical protein GXO88_07795 [Chlorobi bacterium]|nr:hypothetical protein [Chlorobiota bacterium]